MNPITTLKRFTVRGLVAGAAGTIAMDALWYSRYRAGGGTSSPAAWELHAGVDSFDDAPAPAKVGKHLAGLVGIDLPPSSVSATNNVVHWATGLSWGVAAAALRTARVPAVRAGILAGAAAFATSYAVLPKLGIYKRITEYDATTIAKDASAHLVFGTTVGLTGLLIGKRRKAAN